MQLAKIDGYRIKSISKDVLELDDSMMWDGGYYYRLEDAR
jgi:hypothetical protein